MSNMFSNIIFLEPSTVFFLVIYDSDWYVIIFVIVTHNITLILTLDPKIENKK